MTGFQGYCSFVKIKKKTASFELTIICKSFRYFQQRKTFLFLSFVYTHRPKIEMAAKLRRKEKYLYFSGNRKPVNKRTDPLLKPHHEKRAQKRTKTALLSRVTGIYMISPRKGTGRGPQLRCGCFIKQRRSAAALHTTNQTYIKKTLVLTIPPCLPPKVTLLPLFLNTVCSYCQYEQTQKTTNLSFNLVVEHVR